MKDKVQKIREEVERLKEIGCASPIVICDTLLAFIDSLQKEPVKIKKGCKYLCLGDMFNNDTGKIGFIGGKIYLAPEDNTLVSEENGWRCDTSENASNFELVEEPVSIWHDASEKPERDDLLIETNDGRIIHRQSINNYGMVKRWAYTSALLNLDNSCNLRNNLQEEPVSEDLGDYINELSKRFPEVSFAKLSRIAVRADKWKEQQIIANTADAMIGLPYENKDGGYTHLVDVSRPLPVGDNKIAIIFKEAKMSKAEELAKKYCEGSSFEDACMEKPAYIAGYHQAEKDMELSWEEIYSILYFEREVLRKFGNEEHSNEEVCKEVLTRFKATKEK